MFIIKSLIINNSILVLHSNPFYLHCILQGATINLPDLDYRALLNLIGSLIIGYIGYRQHIDGKKTENNGKMLGNTIETINKLEQTLGSTLERLDRSQTEIHSIRQACAEKEQALNKEILQLMQEINKLQMENEKLKG